jgi:hypothetical protein
MVSERRSEAAAINEIQRQMAQIRQELHHDIQGAVRGAQSLTDWRSAVGNHPWLSLAIAAAAGYLIVPERRRETRTVVTVGPPPGPDPMPASPVSAGSRGRSRWSAIETAYNLLAPVAVRAAQNYALQLLERWLAAHPFPMPPDALAPERADGSDRPADHPRHATRFFDVR